ncbi:MAG: response regulator transcription factor [Chitinophagaceae bacterium]|jgi:two-component system alkaline phosphatase synthesis response regulator PhoP|nr:response regulator transcription factor [Chitinophagaceae bacterium]
MNNFFAVLLVEDEEGLHHTLKLNLELENYEVTSAYNGAEALIKLQQGHYDLVILDVMIPKVDGLSVLETMRLHKIDSPVLILSAKNTSADRIAGLRRGADDYLTKPFELEELLLRIANLIQKNKRQAVEQAAPSSYSFGGHYIDFKAQQAHIQGGTAISLSKKEAMLLQLLVTHPNEVVTREKILQVVWGYQVFPNTRTIDNFILTFRKHFEPDSRQPRYFHSVRGLGYKFTPQAPAEVELAGA